jgi:hypothetical protein
MKNLTLIGLVSMLSLAACASDSDTSNNGGNPRPSKQDAARAVQAATVGLDAAQSGAAQHRAALRAPLVENVDYSDACEISGSFDVSGSYDYSLDSAASSFDLDTSFTACEVPEGTLDGTLHWTQEVSDLGDITESLTGTLDFSDSTTSASCAFDLTIDVGASGTHYSGSACGYDVAELDLAI